MALRILARHMALTSYHHFYHGVCYTAYDNDDCQW